MNGENDLPDGWISVSFPEICEINPKKPPRDSIPSDTHVTFVPMPAVDANLGAITSAETRKFGEVRNGFTFFQDGDVIIAKITPCMENGKAAIARKLINGMGFGSTEFFTLRSNGSVIPEYLYHYIRQQSFRKDAEENMTGSVGQKRVPKHFIENSIIPLPPLAEQRRIVAAVESLLERVNASRDRLDRVPGLLKAFRQAVLAAACSGRLTEGWRGENNDLEPISAFLKTAYIQKKVFRGNFKLKQLDSSKLPILPKLWEWHLVHEVAERVTVGHVGPMKDEYVNEGIPFLRSQNVREWGFDPSGLIFITKEFHERIKKSVLKPQDLVIVRSGNVGTACTIPDILLEANCSDLVIVKQPFGFISEYGAYFLNSIAKSDIDAGKVGIALSHFNTQSVANLPIPLPPLVEQHEIVRRVEALFALADHIEQRVNTGKERADRLTQAILAKAFRGELVPTEAELARIEGREYEPASVLLERITAEKAQDGPKRKRK